MNKSMVHSVVLGLAMTVIALPLYAQSTGAASDSGEAVAKVETDGGVIMISDPGEFATAAPGQSVHEKARLMVSEGSSATVVYNDGCKQKYDKPGVYDIPVTCIRPVALSSGPSKGLLIGGAILGSAAVYAIIDNNRDDNRRPISR